MFETINYYKKLRSLLFGSIKMTSDGKNKKSIVIIVHLQKYNSLTIEVKNRDIEP